MFLFLLMTTSLVWSKGQAYHVGDLYIAEDGTQGIVYYVFPDGSGWAVSLHDLPMDYKWGDQQHDIPNLPNYGESDPLTYIYYPLYAMADTAGYSNTMAILNSPQSIQTAAFGISSALSGWYLPSAGQLSMLFAQLPLIETPLAEAGGTPLNNSLGISYWSSTEKDASAAWTVNFSLPIPTSENQFIYSHSGELIPENKTTARSVRAVRSFPPPNSYYDTTLTYLWNTGSTEPHIQDVPLENSTYSVTVTNAYGCTNTAHGSVTVLDNEPQILYDTVCVGTTYHNYGFTLSAEETSGAGEIVLSRTVTAAGCESEITLFLTVRPHDTVYLEKTVYLSYAWNGITYYESGTYTQYLNSIAGCDSVVIMELTVIDTLPAENVTDSLVIYLPNTITPSRSDGRNDCFYLPEAYHSFISDFEIRVFNRWGEQIFYSTDKNFRWYGEYKGKTFYDTVYNYLIRYHDSRGKPYLLRGTITVL